jgi:hypothetical protein
MTGPPPSPGSGWIRISHQEFVEEQVRVGLRWLDGLIQDQSDPDLRKAMERNRLKLQVEIAAAVRQALADPTKELPT